MSQTQPANGAQKVIFQTNILEEVALKFSTGQDAPSRIQGYADQVAFTLVDGRRMYVAPIAADYIAKAGIVPGEPFRIGKKEIREGQKRIVRWIVERIPAETDLEADLRRSAAIASAPRPPGSAPNWNTRPPSPPRAESAPLPAGPAQNPQRPAGLSTQPAASGGYAPMPKDVRNGNGTSLAALLGPPLKMPFDRAMEYFLIIAGRATRAAEKTLGADGGSVRFDSRDVAALATTLLIEAFRSDRLACSQDWPRGPAVE